MQKAFLELTMSSQQQDELGSKLTEILATTTSHETYRGLHAAVVKLTQDLRASIWKN